MKLNSSESAFAFVSAKANLTEDRYDHELMLYDIEKSEVRPLMKLERKPIFEWVGDDRLLILGAFEEADKETEDKGIPITVFSYLDVNTGVLERAFEINHEVADLRIIGKDRFLLLTAESTIRKAWLDEANGDRDKYAEIKKREDRVIIADEYPFYSDGSGLIAGDRGRIYFCDGGNLTKITNDSLNVLGMDSFNDKYGVFYGIPAEGYQKNQELYTPPDTYSDMVIVVETE